MAKIRAPVENILEVMEKNRLRSPDIGDDSNENNKRALTEQPSSGKKAIPLSPLEDNGSLQSIHGDSKVESVATGEENSDIKKWTSTADESSKEEDVLTAKVMQKPSLGSSENLAVIEKSSSAATAASSGKPAAVLKKKPPSTKTPAVDEKNVPHPATEEGATKANPLLTKSLADRVIAWSKTIGLPTPKPEFDGKPIINGPSSPSNANMSRSTPKSSVFSELFTDQPHQLQASTAGSTCDLSSTPLSLPDADNPNQHEGNIPKALRRLSNQYLRRTGSPENPRKDSPTKESRTSNESTPTPTTALNADQKGKAKANENMQNQSKADNQEKNYDLFSLTPPAKPVYFSIDHMPSANVGHSTPRSVATPALSALDAPKPPARNPPLVSYARNADPKVSRRAFAKPRRRVSAEEMFRLRDVDRVNREQLNRRDRGLRRWRCCQCANKTHWESSVCSDLSCLHVRCDGGDWKEGPGCHFVEG